MLTAWLPVAPEHHAAGRMVQLFSLRGIPSQWDADFSFTTSICQYQSHMDPDSVPHLCCCLPPDKQGLLVLGMQCSRAESPQLSLNHSQETWPIRQTSVIYVQTWQATFLFLPPALQGGTLEERTVFLCSLVSGWWFPPSLLSHCNFTLPPARLTILLPVIPLGQSFQGSFQKYPVVPFLELVGLTDQTPLTTHWHPLLTIYLVGYSHSDCKWLSVLAAGFHLLYWCALWHRFSLPVSLLINQLRCPMNHWTKWCPHNSVLWKFHCLGLRFQGEQFGTYLSAQRIFFPGAARVTCTMCQAFSLRVTDHSRLFLGVERKLFTKSILFSSHSSNGWLLQLSLELSRKSNASGVF